ncbi:hypothetical protein [Halorubellus sp. PRR65]|uniref:hypothetical protein n=1 Tax=Halorubellus sp. PRR65 TaxID=3098148 RepID=UPI002B256E79|nr:hypothetical protein [Halorubellus sp. PRR65]
MTRNWYRWTLFAGIGVWVGGVLATLLGVGAVALALGPWWAGVAIGLLSGVAGGVAGGRAAYDRSMHDRLHGTLGVASFVGIPVVFLAVVLAYVVFVTAPSDAIVGALLAGAIASTIGGLVALLANVPLWKWSVQEGSTLYASWSARQPPTQRRHSKYAAGILAAIAIACVPAALVLDLELASTNWWLALAPFTAVVASIDGERTVEVRDGGVLVDSSLVAWPDFDAFELTDDALVLHRASRYFERADRFDREDIEDVDAATEALERFLDRRER